MGLVTGGGQAVSLGQEIGRGGEGSVFEVVGSPTVVAKLYHSALDRPKQNKLRFMSGHSSESLRSFTSWPQDTLHNKQGGDVVGFLMQRISSCVPIHNLYSPAHRRQVFPKVGWDYLLCAARNTAAAFDALHGHGHVLGDVNQGNVMVQKDARVLLIDSDSFQVRTPAVTYLCEVGVSHFTPPELQGISGFSGVQRTIQHDVFGLALLVFHLLFGGRHPYSGVPLIREAGNALEDDIRGLRFAYARDAADRGLAPPPRSIPMSLVPVNVEGMFRYAFTEPGIKGQRPTAADWVAALDEVLCDLRRCEHTSLHAYPRHLSQCPWCELDNTGVVYFVDLMPPRATTNAFHIAMVWSQIEAIGCPPTPAARAFQTTTPVPRPLPPMADRGGEIVVMRGFIVATMTGLSFVMPDAFFLFLLAAMAAWGMVGTIGEAERKAERSKRESALRDATQAMGAAEAIARSESGAELFIVRKQHLLNLRNEYACLAAIEQKDLAALHSTAQERQRQKFLEQFFIEDALISGVGPAKKSSLQSFGIETAADVNWGRVQAVRGFGSVLTSAVVQWRQQCEQRFRYDSQRAVSQADVDAVKARIAHRRKQLEVALSRGANELWNIQQQGKTKTSVLQSQLATAAARLAQARVDMTVFK